MLSNGFEPVARIPWQKAMTLFFSNKIEILEEYEDREIRSVSFSIKMPSVVRFLRFMRGKRKAIKFSRENVYCRDRGECQYCGRKVPRAEATYDHVVPRAQGGRTEWTNIVISCMPCNQGKGGRTPEQAKMKLLSVPVRPKKLDETFRLTFSWKPGMPDTWKQWLNSVAYWNTELESDE